LHKINESLRSLANRLPGWSGASLSRRRNQSLERPVRQKKEAMTTGHRVWEVDLGLHGPGCKGCSCYGCYYAEPDPLKSAVAFAHKQAMDAAEEDWLERFPMTRLHDDEEEKAALAARPSGYCGEWGGLVAVCPQDSATGMCADGERIYYMRVEREKCTVQRVTFSAETEYLRGVPLVQP
jgi:hypothetical protein